MEVTIMVSKTNTPVPGESHRRRGRPKKINGESKTLTLRLSADELEKLDADAADHGLKRSDWLRMLIDGEVKAPRAQTSSGEDLSEDASGAGDGGAV